VSATDLISIATASGAEGFCQKAASADEIIGQSLTTVADGEDCVVRLFNSVSVAP
jgi:hypothetical protein